MPVPEALAALRLLHVVLAIVAVGANLTFPLWIRLAERDVAHLRFTLLGIRWLDRYVAIPAYGLLALTGLALAVLGAVPLTTAWLAVSIALYAGVAVLGFAVYRPVSRARLAALESGSPGDLAYRRARQQARALDGMVIAAVLVILALMVLKPF